MIVVEVPRFLLALIGTIQFQIQLIDLTSERIFGPIGKVFGEQLDVSAVLKVALF